MIGRLHFENIMNIFKIESEENEFVKIYFRASTASFLRATYNPNLYTNPDPKPAMTVFCRTIKGCEMNCLEMNYPVPL